MEQTGAIMIKYEKLLFDDPSQLCIVVGDVTSTMACAITAQKMGVPVAHVEAGIRSGDWTMPEEINRMVTDVISDLLLTPSLDGDENLLAEGKTRESIVCVGNVMIDTLFMNLPKAKELKTLEELSLKKGNYAVLTMHRPSNVDDESAFTRVTNALLKIADQIPVVFPVHPRAAKNMDKFGLTTRFESHQKIQLLKVQEQRRKRRKA